MILFRMSDYLRHSLNVAGPAVTGVRGFEFMDPANPGAETPNHLTIELFGAGVTLDDVERTREALQADAASGIKVHVIGGPLSVDIRRSVDVRNAERLRRQKDRDRLADEADDLNRSLLSFAASLNERLKLYTRAVDEAYERRGDEDEVLHYVGIGIDGRASVREPFNPPTLRLARNKPYGQRVEVKLNESQLTAIIADAARALDKLRASRRLRTEAGQ